MNFKLILLLVSSCCLGLALVSGFAPNETEILRAIADSVAAAELRERSGEDYFAADKECFPDLGCILKSGPMKHTGIFPEPLAKIGTKFYAFSSAASSHLVDPHNVASFSAVNAAKRLVFVTHGFGGSHKSEGLNSIKNHLLSSSNHEVGTVIMVDWEHGAVFPHYNEAATNTQVVGRQVAHLVNELHKHHNVNPANVYLVGHSLGAQVSGFAGKFSQTEYHWKFGRITGLDAAAPFFEGRAGSYLTRTDATFVDAIHTSIGTNIIQGELGFTQAYAHLDFFPNSGHNQPGCGPIGAINFCNHNRAVDLYDSSLAAHGTCKFNAQACANWKTFTEHKCNSHVDVEMGYWGDHGHVHGVRYLSTTANRPYCH